MAQIDYIETPDQVTVSGGSFQAWDLGGGADLEITVAPPGGVWEVQLFVPVVQSTTDNSLLFLQLYDATNSIQLGLMAAQSFLGGGSLQTWGPLVYTRRLPDFSGSSRLIQARYAQTGSSWKLLVDPLDPNTAYLRADTV